jgi:hypothetical protein
VCNRGDLSHCSVFELLPAKHTHSEADQASMQQPTSSSHLRFLRAPCAVCVMLMALLLLLLPLTPLPSAICVHNKSSSAANLTALHEPHAMGDALRLC